MPVTQLTDQGGIGNIIGMVGGYLLGNPARKAKKAQQDIENKRNAAGDARSDKQAQDYHDNITSEIATRNATGARETTDANNTQFQQGAYGKLSTMLRNKPEGVTAQQWVAQVQKQVPTLGLTDPKLLGQLYTDAQGVITQDQTTQNAAFAGGEMALPSDPAKRLAVLMKRLQIERSRPGFDVKPTETAIADTQKQIAEAQVAAHQSSTEGETRRHNRAMENRPHGGGGSGVGLADLAERKREFDLTHNKDGSAKGRGESNVTPVQRAAALRGAMSTLAAQQIQTPKDPNFPAVLKQFADPTNRDAILADPHMPPATKAYLQQLDAMTP